MTELRATIFTNGNLPPEVQEVFSDPERVAKELCSRLKISSDNVQPFIMGTVGKECVAGYEISLPNRGSFRQALQDLASAFQDIVVEVTEPGVLGPRRLNAKTVQPAAPTRCQL